jgi:hypothetical protein
VATVRFDTIGGLLGSPSNYCFGDLLRQACPIYALADGLDGNADVKYCFGKDYDHGVRDMCEIQVVPLPGADRNKRLTDVTSIRRRRSCRSHANEAYPSWTAGVSSFARLSSVSQVDASTILRAINWEARPTSSQPRWQ